ncbi:MAG: hypothetical protein ACD_75C00452G0002 [uncultured bacterium]|nr:MAG: hypothetical protein ACD_75C00452G0002 [uncultured bacterium]
MKKKIVRTCITPEGKFQYGVHKPSYAVANLRQDTNLALLGLTADNEPVANDRNFPIGNISVPDADWIFEIPNPFPFRGCTYIDKEWADASADNPGRIRLPAPPRVSLSETLQEAEISRDFFNRLPAPLLLALATCSTDPADLIRLAEFSCEILKAPDQPDRPMGLRYRKDDTGRLRPMIGNHPLFEAVANNPYLPDAYKIVMVIRPGAQGASEIVGEWPKDDTTHVFEYLRRNSYIPGGHYAANMADDAVRYRINDLGPGDIKGLRHLYYQRTFVRLAGELQLSLPAAEKMLSEDELETLRLAVVAKLPKEGNGTATGAAAGATGATLWGWNFGFDFAPTEYRLHASHQQIHQQYAMVPGEVAAYNDGTEQSVGQFPSYSCGDLLTDLIVDYNNIHHRDFFSDYRSALAANRRMDNRNDLPASLTVWSDSRVMVFVPKAQTSQWELQLMTLPDENGYLAGNIVECDRLMRHSLDTGILMAQKALAGLGARMVTSIEYSKRLTAGNPHQPLLYALLPRLPESPGAFSEAQLRFINGHYPEDFAAACRKQLER